MSIIPPGEKIIESKICRLSGQEFFVTDKDVEFYDKVSPVFGGKKYSIPSPSLSPDERMRRRMSFRNENNLYKRTCALTHREIISMYSSESPIIVYDHAAWWSDDWHISDYQQKFNFSTPFFDQFQKFSQSVPCPGLYNSNNENSQYNNYIIGCKNSYMSSVVYYGSENILYSHWIFNSKDIIDSIQIYDSEKCYYSVQLNNCNNCRVLVRSSNCTDCLFSQYLIGCTDCLLCSGLFQKQYHILNVPYSKEEYNAKKREFLGLSEVSLMKYFHNFMSQQTVRDTFSFKCENSIGNGIINCRDSFVCFDSINLEACKHINGENMKNCYDGIGGKINNSYEFNFAGITGDDCCFVNDTINSSSILYCSGVYNVTDCFACSGLHEHEHHCILNTPYSVQEYETLCGKIIDHMKSTGEWGEFFPHELSPFGYNETIAAEYFPLTESEIKGKGWNWHTEEERKFEGVPYIPLLIKEYDETKVGYETAQKNIDEILSGIIQCEVTKKPFKIIKQELVFYIENSISIATKHPGQRHKERMDLMNPRTLYERQCSQCKQNIITTYSPLRPEKVVCEECYRKLIY